MAKRKNGSKDNFQDKFAEDQYEKGRRDQYSRDRRDRKPFNPKHENPRHVVRDYKAKRGDIKDQKITPIMIGSNDDSWHVPNAQLVDSTARMSFEINTGRGIADRRLEEAPSIVGTSILNGGAFPCNVPGIMIMPVFNGIGYTQFAEDPFNKGSQLIFNYMQRLTGRSPSYDTAQVGMYIRALGDAYGFYQHIVRIYGCLNTRSLVSRYLPRILVESLGADYNDLSANMANFRTFINQFALDLGSLPLPNNVTYLQWYLNQFETIYTDAKTEKAQMYAFIPAGFYQFIEGVESDPITHLTFMPLVSSGTSGELMTYSDIITYGQQLIAPLLSSEDIRIMKSDILNTFGNDLFQVNPIAETFTIFPEYNPEMSSVIENTYLYGIDPSKIVSEIRENTGINGGYCVSTNRFVPYQLSKWNGLLDTAQLDSWTTDPMTYFTGTECVFNWHEDTPPEPARALTVTRYSGYGLQGAVLSEGVEKRIQYYQGVYGGAYNIVCYAKFYWIGSNGQRATSILHNNYLIRTDTDKLYNITNDVAMWSKFDWAPQVRFVCAEVAGTKINMFQSDILCDLDNFAMINIQQLENMNEVSMEGEMIPRGLGGYSPIQ